MEAQLSAMEIIETSELLEIIVETEAEAGVSGMSVAGGGREGLFVRDVLQDSPAARSLSLKEGDQLLSARVYFDNIKYEDALQILKCAEPYKVSFCLKRTVPSADVTHKPGAPTFEVRGPKAKMARLNIQSLTALKKKKKKKKKKVAVVVGRGMQEAEAPGSRKPELVPVDVEFSLPTFSRLRKAKSAGEVAVAEPSPDRSPHLSSLETRRHKLKFPRLKVKEAAAAATLAARAEGRLGGGRAEAEGRPARFAIPFPKGKKPKGEGAGAGAKLQAGFQAPQVELGLPLPKGGEPPTAKGEGFRIQAPRLELPKVSAVGLEGPEGGIQAGLRLPTAEVAAPKLEVTLSLPRLEGAAPEVALEGGGFRAPKLGASTEEPERKLPTFKPPALEVALGQGRGVAGGLEERPGLAAAMPTLEVGAPSVDLELLLPKGKAEEEPRKPRMEIPEVSVKVPSVSLPRLGARAPEELEAKLPQVELGVGKPESPKAKAKGPKIQIPGFGVSLLERKEGAQRVAAEGKRAGVSVPALDLSVPGLTEVELAAHALGAKVEEAAEEARLKLQLPQVSLPKLDILAKTSPPQIHAKLPKPEVEVGVAVGVPKLDLALPAVKVPDVQLPKPHLPKPGLDVSVEKPKVEVAVSVARLSFPSAAVPALEIDVPRVGVEVGLPKAEGGKPSWDHEATLRRPTLETVGQDLGVEISVPTCRLGQTEPEPSGEVFEGPDISEMVTKIPKVDLAFGKEPPASEGARGVEVGLGLKGKAWPKVELELEGPPGGAQMKVPSVEIPAITLPAAAAAESGRSPEAKLKASKFALPKFSISGPKAWKASAEASVPEREGPEAADRGLKLKMPKFGISFPKSKWGAEAESPKLALGLEGKVPKERAAMGPEASDWGLRLPSVTLPAVDIVGPSGAVEIGLLPGKAELRDQEGSRASPEVGIDLPEIKLKVPQVSLPKCGDQGGEGGEEAKPKGGAKFKMPLFGMGRREAAEGPGADVGGKSKLAPGSPKEKAPGPPSARMPKLKPSSPKPEAEAGRLHIQAKIPQVELPKIGLKEEPAEEGLAVGSGSPSLRAKVPELEIAVPGARAEGELALGLPVVDVSEVDLGGYEGELKIPRVELDIGLPTASAEASRPHATISTDAKVKVPKVELPTFGRGDEEGAEVQLVEGGRLSRGREREVAEGSLLDTKIRVPRVDISLPKARLLDAERPLTEGEAATEGTEEKFKMPSVGLPKFSAPKMRAPELEFDMSLEGGKLPKAKVSGPAIKLPKFGGSGSDGEGEPEMDLPKVPQLELKAPQLRGSSETPGSETGAKEGKLKMPSVPISLALSKAGAEGATGTEEGRFKLKIPSVSISRAGAESSTDTQPLVPSAVGPDFSFKMPQIALPDVGFSVDQEGKREKLSGGADLDVGGGLEARLKMPKVKMPSLGVSGPKGDTEAAAPPPGRRGSGGEDSEGKGAGAAFQVPGLELAAPSLQGHAKYEVEGAQLRPSGSQVLEVAGKRGRAGSDGQKSPAGKGGPSDADAGKKYRVKIPKFGLALPKAGAEAGEGGSGQAAEAKGRRPMIFLQRWPKGKGAEGSSGLLEGGEEEADSKGVMAKLKLRPGFGLALSKPKAGAQVNGELEEAGASKLKMPKLGFSKAEGGERAEEEQEASVPNGAQDSKSELGKIRLPQLELSSSSKLAQADPHAGPPGTFPALKAARFKAPKITFSGPKKRNGEAAPGAVVSSAARTEMASLETGDAAAKGEKSSPRFRFPKLVLSPKAQGLLEITSGSEEAEEEGLKLKLPKVGFSGELSSEEQGLAAAGGRPVSRAEGEAAAAVV
ncbi:periaxin isoform X2 [Hemicordylus capensis]|uniref:periaxin isoform X2 n=1 Tax=Hemicordylus capensis TaxID=884348 RepID=UPI0023027819|nr:periaxin isoform X2 [Hemicordylus capensis]